MTEPQERRWDGPSMMSIAEWVAAELERAPEPSDEQRGALSALFNTATSTTAA
ncbi:hypothetical protein ACQEVY_25245 [Streptomyces sp. CA-288835]|uniref:hypothetical protein n=1 Tax=Streptomyces sp. CA-288835 TaxID=3240069 RepID=UPI003D8D711E